jgi:hypothetical protein
VANLTGSARGGGRALTAMVGHRRCMKKRALGTAGFRALEVSCGARANRRLAPLVLVVLALEARCRAGPRSETPPTLQAQASQPGSECPAGRRVVWRGDLRDAGWLQRWDPGATFLYGGSNATLVEDARFEGVLRVAYPAGSSSSSYAREGHPLGGLEFKAHLATNVGAQSIYLSYWLRFAPNFRWMKGGKLPGVCGGGCPSGGAAVTGYDGWSMRIMWRPGGDGEEYAYILPAQAYGTELGLGEWKFSIGQWHHLAQEIVLNSGGAANGVSRVWFDVDPTLPPTFEAKGLTYRLDDGPADGADTLFFSTFFGGHDAGWSTPVDTFVDFANFVACR